MHEEIIGKSGTGKSTHIENLVLTHDDGCTFIDPHGQSAEKLADTQECIYWEPANPNCPLAINVLADVPPAHRPLVAEQVISSIKSIHRDSWGPNLEDILRNALYLLLDNSKSLVQLSRVLSDVAYRARLLRRCSNEAVRDFWKIEFPAKSDRQQAEELRSTQNKVRMFALNPMLRRVLSHNSINLARVMNKRQRLVVNLSVGQIGEAPASILGALLINGFYQAAISRSAISENERVPHRLFIDEYQNFTTDTFANIVSEARKYKLFLTVAHQYTAQVPEPILKAVLSNVGKITAFRVSAEDAAFLAPEFGFTRLTALAETHNYEAWVISGIYQPQLIRTLPPAPSLGKLKAVQARTRARYTRKVGGS